MWFILLERVSTKDRLCRFNCIPPSELTYVLCSAADESVEHLFFACPIAWMFWYKCLQWWGISWCYQNKPILFFEAWTGAPFWGFDKKLWTSLMSVVFWSIWRARNRIIFEKAKPNWELEIYQVRLCLAYWAKAWCPDLPFSLDYIAQNLHQMRKWRGGHNHHRLR